MEIHVSAFWRDESGKVYGSTTLIMFKVLQGHIDQGAFLGAEPQVGYRIG